MRTLEILTLLILLAGLVIFLFRADWIMSLRIRAFKKSLREGKEIINSLENSIADIKGKMAADPGKYACLDPMLKSLEKHRELLQAKTDKFQQNLEYVIAMRNAIRNPAPPPATVSDVQQSLIDYEKLDTFLRQLHGDK